MNIPDPETTEQERGRLLAVAVSSLLGAVVLVTLLFFLYGFGAGLMGLVACVLEALFAVAYLLISQQSGRHRPL